MAKKPTVTIMKPPAFDLGQAEDFVRSTLTPNANVDVVANINVDAPAFADPKRSTLTPNVSVGVNANVNVDDNVPTFQKSGRAALVSTKQGAKRRTTVYFPLDVAHELADYCADSHMDMSHVVSVAVRRLIREGKGSQ